VILVRNGGANQGHDAVAQHLIDGALKAVHGLHRALDGRVEELLRGFRVKVFDEFSRVFEVGKQHCHLFAFALQPAA
jgi:hypothetical protein